MSVARVYFLEAGYTNHLEAISIRGGRLKTVRFPATVAVLEHSSQGVILFDTGYSERFFEQTKYFPNRFYSLITPVTISPEKTAVRQLKNRGIKAQDVRQVVLSHFHADHIGGAGDFPHAKYVYRKSALDAVRTLGNWRAVRAGFLRGLLPNDFEARSRPLVDADFVFPIDIAGFGRGCDLYGDSSVIAVDLPGHANGQIGLRVNADDGCRYFLVADACWGQTAYREARPPHGVVKSIFSDWASYNKTLRDIQAASSQRPDLKIVPCHCDQTLAELRHDGP